MYRILLALTSIIAAFLAWSPASAQQWTPGGQGVPIVCAYNSSQPAVASGDFVYAQCDSKGNLVSGGGGGGGGTSSSFATTFPTTGTAVGAEYYTPGTLTSGNMYPLTLDQYGYLEVDIGNAAGAVYVNQYNPGPVSSAWPMEMVYSLGGALTAVPGTTYGPEFDCSSSSELCTLLASAVPGTANSAVDPTAVTDTSTVSLRTDDYGNLVTVPNAPSGLNWTASSGATTGTSMSFSGSSKSSYYTYITDMMCGRSDAGTTAITITLNDAATTIFILPNSGGGGGNNKAFTTPLKISSATGTALTGTLSAGVTTAYCTFSGFFRKT
jgi:hypothetical protein